MREFIWERCQADDKATDEIMGYINKWHVENKPKIDEEKVFNIAHDCIMKNADKNSMIWFGDTAQDIAKAIANADIYK